MATKIPFWKLPEEPPLYHCPSQGQPILDYKHAQQWKQQAVRRKQNSPPKYIGSDPVARGPKMGEVEIEIHIFDFDSILDFKRPNRNADRSSSGSRCRKFDLKTKILDFDSIWAKTDRNTPWDRGFESRICRNWGLVTLDLPHQVTFALAHATLNLTRVDKLTWLVLGEDPAARSHRVEQFTAL